MLFAEYWGKVRPRRVILLIKRSDSIINTELLNHCKLLILFILFICFIITSSTVESRITVHYTEHMPRYRISKNVFCLFSQNSRIPPRTSERASVVTAELYCIADHTTIQESGRIGSALSGLRYRIWRSRKFRLPWKAIPNFSSDNVMMRPPFS